MKIKATKVFAKYLQKQLPEYDIALVELSDDHYRMLTGECVYEAEQWGDFNNQTRATKAIRISYPAEYYATPRYLSTREVSQIFKGVSTQEKLDTEIQNALAI